MDTRPGGIDLQVACQLRLRAILAALLVLDLPSECDVKQAACLLPGLKSQADTVVAEFADEDRLPGLHVVDLPDIAAFDVTAEAVFDLVQQLDG